MFYMQQRHVHRSFITLFDPTRTHKTHTHTQVGLARDPSSLKSMEAPEDIQDIPPALQSEPQPIETTGGILDVVTRCVVAALHCALLGD
jgi:hypothetical protein